MLPLFAVAAILDVFAATLSTRIDGSICDPRTSASATVGYVEQRGGCYRHGAAVSGVGQS